MAAIPLWAGPGVPFFEINRPIVNQVVLAGAPNINLLPNQTSIIQLLDPVAGPYNVPYQSTIFEIVIVLDITVPAGQTETSDLNFLLTGNTGRPLDLKYDTGGLVYTFDNVAVSQNDVTLQISGCVRYGVVEPLILQLSRVGGNPAIDMVVTNIYSKLKVVD